jgi:MoaA/NifB/PqqE/SkfB family radical SAM enzyme
MKPFKIIYLELTNACNFKCDYCPIDQQTRKKVVMSEDFAQNIMDQIVKDDLTDFLTFHVMGEPYLHKKLAELTKYAEDRGLMVRLLTNGSLLNSGINKALFDAGLSRLEIGFRTPNDNSFNARLRSAGLTLDEYIERVKGLLTDAIRLRPKTEVCLKFFVRSHAALFRLSESHEHLTSKQDNLRVVNTFQAHILEVAKECGYSVEKWQKPIKITVNNDYEIFPGITVGFSRIQDFWIREQRGISAQQGFPAKICGCSAGFRDDFGILASGEVTTCCVDYDGRNVIGDLHQQTLMEILESSEALRIRKSLRRFSPPTEFCKECMGGPTLTTSYLKQASTVMIDIKDRIKPRKAYTHMRKRIGEREI